MRRVFLALAGTAFLLSAAAAETNELEAVDVEETDDGGLSVEVSMDVLSDYMWRGTICNGNPVWQPSVTVGYDAGDFGTVSANVWRGRVSQPLLFWYNNAHERFFERERKSKEETQ